MVGKAFACLAGMALGALSLAGPSGLTGIPTADILGHREAVYSFGATGFERQVSKGYNWTHGFTLGLYDVAEAGWDNDTPGNTTLNFKLALYQNNKTGWALSAGVKDVGLIGNSVCRYAVARKDFQNLRLHAGWQGDDRNRCLAGLDCALGNGWSCSGDYTSGEGGVSWVTLNVPFALKGLSLSLACGLPNDHAEGVQHQFSVGYGFNF